MSETLTCKNCGSSYVISFLGWRNEELCQACFNRPPSTSAAASSTPAADESRRNLRKDWAPKRWIADNQAVTAYVLAHPVSGIVLNLYAAVGLITVALFLVMAFGRLGRDAIGYRYWIALFALITLSKGTAWPLALIIYGVAWFHLNAIHNDCRATARTRLELISRGKDVTVDTLLESGLLHYSWLNHQEAQRMLLAALQQPGGDVFFLFVAGKTFMRYKDYAHATECFRRALSTCTDSDHQIREMIERNAPRAEKLAKKVSR